jgi:hypothetical protein
MFEDESAQELDRTHGLGPTPGGRQHDAAEPVDPVHVACGARGFDERAHGAGSDRDVGCIRRVEDAQRVVDDLRERCVARDAGDAEHLDRGMSHREQDRKGIVDTGVDVEDHGNAHRITVASPRLTRSLGCRGNGPRGRRST